MSFVHPAMSGLKDPLEAFHDASGGNLQEIAELFAAMSGQFLPPEIICQLMGLELGEGDGGLPKASKEQLLRGIEAALDDGDTAEKYAPIIEAQTAGLEGRRELARRKDAYEVSEEFALEIEQRLLDGMRADEDLKKHNEAARAGHDAWRDSGRDPKDSAAFPCVVMGPMVLALDRVLAVAHGSVLTQAERETAGLSQQDDAVSFLLVKMRKHRALVGGKVARAQAERVAWLANAVTGTPISADALGDHAALARMDAATARLVREAAFHERVGKVLGDVSIGTSDDRVRVVEGMLAGAVAAGAAEAGAAEGYAGCVLTACVAALDAERGVAAEGGAAEAVRAVRRQIGDRFFRKKWLPLESNPEIFNALAGQLGMPPGVCFHEVFGLDADLLAMVPSPASAVLVCFPLTESYKDKAASAQALGAVEGLYFMRQTIPNACGTIAMIHAFANLPGGGGGGGWLDDFVGATKGMGGLERAKALEEDESLAVAHNDMAKRGDTNVAAFSESGPKGAFNAVLHFICYAHAHGKIYELDGLKQGPVQVGEGGPEDLLGVAAAVVSKYAQEADEVRINLMALAPAQ
uniref:Ubiquitin carboxyl-terminal hydrolase n=1 Tax=Hemiselmis tepida TaxID=464990 RepID=A0A7S0VS93_9CRYP|mmetsp:Transcript_26084/g.66381  ORF Transcript_26084/g.66381 Transcript_26084/m.66381 type:complete len:579 (+) Transcript_26084:60-1796(+)